MTYRKTRHTVTIAAMSSSPLADFLEQLAGCGELARVGVEVDPAAEIGEITRRVAGEGGPAILFERVHGSGSGGGDQPAG